MSSPWTALSYDALGRLASIDSAADTNFAYDGLDMIVEYAPNGAIQARYVHGPGMDQPLVRYDGAGTGNKQSLHADERGSIAALSYGSPYAPLINRYDEFGKPQNSNVGRFQYTGQMWLPEAGVYHYKHRAYAAHLGRFLQTDPLGYDGGPNLYAYVLNDPVNLVDPTGLCTFYGFAHFVSRWGAGGYGPREHTHDTWERSSGCDRSSSEDRFTAEGGFEGGGPSGEDIRVTSQRPRTRRLSRCMIKFLSSFDPSVNWAKVNIIVGGSIPGMAATTFGYDIHFARSNFSASLLFHELGHVPQWNSGSLTYRSYARQAIGAAFKYGGAFTSRNVSIHDRMPIERAAIVYGEELTKAYRNAKPCP